MKPLHCFKTKQIKTKQTIQKQKQNKTKKQLARWYCAMAASNFDLGMDAVLQCSQSSSIDYWCMLSASSFTFAITRRRPGQQWKQRKQCPTSVDRFNFAAHFNHNYAAYRTNNAKSIRYWASQGWSPRNTQKYLDIANLKTVRSNLLRIS